MSNKLFRESALERLSSPEQLDQVLVTTSPRGWISLGALWVLLGMVVAWAVFDKVPVQERGYGIIIPGEGMRTIVASGTGRVRELLATVGKRVEADEVVALIDRKDLEDQISEETVRLDMLKAHKDEIDRFDAAEQTEQSKLTEKERLILQKVSEDRRSRAVQQAGVLEEAVRQGVVHGLEKVRMHGEIQSDELIAEESLLQASQSEIRLAAAENQRKREELTRRQRIEELEGQIKLLQGRLKREGEVRAGVAGRILEVRTSQGAMVGWGDPVVVLEPAAPEGQVLRAVLYVAATKGKLIEEGTEVMLVPSTVKREKHGSLLGTVVEAARGPTSQEAMLQRLADPNLVQRFVNDTGVPLEVLVELTPDPQTETTYKWTSGRGPSMALTAGTLCNGWITIETKRPIELALRIFGDEAHP